MTFCLDFKGTVWRSFPSPVSTPDLCLLFMHLCSYCGLPAYTMNTSSRPLNLYFLLWGQNAGTKLTDTNAGFFFVFFFFVIVQRPQKKDFLQIHVVSELKPLLKGSETNYCKLCCFYTDEKAMTKGSVPGQYVDNDSFFPCYSPCFSALVRSKKKKKKKVRCLEIYRLFWFFI